MPELFPEGSPMPMPASELDRLIKTALPDAQVEIVDLAGDDDHFSATVTSAAFAGLTRLKQHQLVYRALGTHLGGTLHALQLQTLTPEP
jgi:stress-induced morphogen